MMGDGVIEIAHPQVGRGCGLRGADRGGDLFRDLGGARPGELVLDTCVERRCERLLRIAYYAVAVLGLHHRLFSVTALYGPRARAKPGATAPYALLAGGVAGLGMLAWSFRVGHRQQRWFTGLPSAAAAPFAFALVTFGGFLMFTNIHWHRWTPRRSTRRGTGGLAAGVLAAYVIFGLTDEFRAPLISAPILAHFLPLPNGDSAVHPLRSRRLGTVGAARSASRGLEGRSAG